ncbi:MAG: type II toxin-antitoxin system VapC family toxin [Candidatus Hydrogenedentes bacterium]|nr:type II toxin-antitoxin system VapC family toxin [Candidatus Hydrogenedentota bacterium]
MKSRVYIETSVVSYLISRTSCDVVTEARQQLTRDWWKEAHHQFDFVISELVKEEAAAGDPLAARERLHILAALTTLETTEDAIALSKQLVESGAVPYKAAQDALHIAIAVTNGVEYLVTWNCRHIANATMRGLIEIVCLKAGHEPTIICTPEELMENDTNV